MIVTESISKIKQDFIIREISDDFYSDLRQFDCSNPSLNNYLKRNAFFNHIDFKSRTQLAYRDSDLLAFFTLKKSHIQLDHVDDEDESKDKDDDLIRSSLDICCLAVDNKYKKQGIGSSIIRYIITLAKTTNERYITLDALYEYWEWYSRRGFDVAFQDDIKNKNTTVFMSMDLYDPELMAKIFNE